MPSRPIVRNGLLALFLWTALTQAGAAQTDSVLTRTANVVDSATTVTLKGNVHPLARLQYDRGKAPDSLPMEHMSFLLRRSAEQETALGKLLQEQQDKSSSNFHKWLTPEQFGEQFGLAIADISAVTDWLTSQGFRVINVSHGRTMIDFSGDASLVRHAFHTEIHRFVVNGEDHWANISDPQVPEDLQSIASGVVGLHNFRPKSMNQRAGIFSRSKATGEVKLIGPRFTFADCGGHCYALGPYDFATIYNVLPLWNAGIDGTNQTIAIVGQSNIQLQDVRNFRSLFGLPAKDPVIIIPPGNNDPGLTDDEVEADLDVEWSGAVAKNAQIIFVTSANVISSAQYVVDANLAPILSVSFGACEFALGASGNQAVNTLWQQAAAEGISVFVASGDEGSAACDRDTFSGAAETGLQVSGVASTPYDTAVGGTDFNYISDPSLYWNSANSTKQASAKSYIPEVPWNNSCASSIFSGLGFGTDPELSCNNPILPVVVAGGGGGKSSCTFSDGLNCLGGYPKPIWQSGTGTPNDAKRDLPDVSLFAGNSFGSFYVVCQADSDPDGSGHSCDLNSPFMHFVGVGGTSASSPAFAGIMALVNQKLGSPQGFANPVLYNLAATQPVSSCNSSRSPANSCIFNDTTEGTNAVPCLAGTADCIVRIPTDSFGVLPGYSAGVGFDLATGLGSVNVTNLVNSWGSGPVVPVPVPPVVTDFGLFPGAAVVRVSSPGKSASVTITANSDGKFSGSLALSCQVSPPSALDSPVCSFIPASILLSPGHTSASTILNISTTAPLSASLNHEHQSVRFVWLMPGGLAVACIFLVNLPGRRWHRTGLFSVLLFLALGMVVSCGGGGSGRINSQNLGTPSGTYTVTVTAMSGGITRTTTISVVVD